MPAPSVSDYAIPGEGTIAGRIDGQAGLVAEAVIAGPDDALRQYARVPVAHENGIGRFVVTGVPPGRYFVTLMGEKGASRFGAPFDATRGCHRDRRRAGRFHGRRGPVEAEFGGPDWIARLPGTRMNMCSFPPPGLRARPGRERRRKKKERR